MQTPREAGAEAEGVAVRENLVRRRSMAGQVTQSWSESGQWGVDSRPGSWVLSCSKSLSALF